LHELWCYLHRAGQKDTWGHTLKNISKITSKNKEPLGCNKHRTHDHDFNWSSSKIIHKDSHTKRKMIFILKNETINLKKDRGFEVCVSQCHKSDLTSLSFIFCSTGLAFSFLLKITMDLFIPSPNDKSSVISQILIWILHIYFSIYIFNVDEFVICNSKRRKMSGTLIAINEWLQRHVIRFRFLMVCIY